MPRFQFRDVTGDTLPFVLNPGATNNLLVLSSTGIGINNPSQSSPSTTRVAPG